MRPGEHRRERGDARHPGIEVGELVNLLVLHVVEEDVRHGVPVGDEGDALSVGRPLRAGIPSYLHAGENLDAAVVQMIERNLEVPHVQGPEVRVRTAVGDEGDGLPVR